MLHCLSFKHELPPDAIVIDVTSNSPSFGRWLSPFNVGPCELYDGYMAYNIENAYQFARVFPGFANDDGSPTEQYWEWAIKGWQTQRPIKYPFGAWTQPMYHWWHGKKLNRLEAQNQIFVPLYKDAVVKTHAYKRLKAIYEHNPDKEIVLLDYEGYRHRFFELDWEGVLNHPDFPIGQGFVLSMLLEGNLIPNE